LPSHPHGGLAGGRDERHLAQPRGLLARASVIPTEPTDYEVAAGLCRSCRRRGETVRKLIDCLIAATAIRTSTAVLQLDHDFEVLARPTPLQLDQS
jgi:predicted nucleic acid-binding protein